MTRYTDPGSLRSETVDGHLGEHLASSLTWGVEHHLPTAATTESERQALVEGGKRYGVGPYEVDVANTAASPTLAQALARRRSATTFTQDDVTFEQVSATVAAYRVTGSRTTAGGRIELRSAPSAGALYTVEVYVAAGNVAGLDAGLYHYRPDDAGLRLIRPDEGDKLVRAVAAVLLDADRSHGAAGALFLTGRIARACDKYRERGYRYVLLEAGHIAQTLALGAAAADLGMLLHGAFYDGAAARLLGIDGHDEAVLAILLFGIAG